MRQPPVDDQRREQREQIEDRISRTAASPGAIPAGSVARLASTVQASAMKTSAERGRGDAIDRAGQAERPRRDRRGGHRQACRGRSGGGSPATPGDDRQHRHPGGGIIGADEQRQRPEMRRGPQEDDREQQQRQRRDSPVAATQPISGGKAPAAPPMTMFCARPPLQPDGIDQHVEQDRRRRAAPPPDDWRRRPSARTEKTASPTPKWSAVWRSIRPAGSGRLAVRRILRVEVGLIPLVERPGRARRRARCTGSR